MSSDNYVYANAMTAQTDENPYKFKEYYYVQDQQGGNYGSGQITFDLAGFSNSNKYTSLSEAVLTLPVIAVLSQNVAAGFAGKINDFAIGWKSGYWNMISSFSVDYDGQTCCQMSQNINAYCSFRANSTWSQGDVDLHGTTTGFNPDTSDCFRYSNVLNSLTGNGINNNINKVANINPVGLYDGETGNAGLIARQLQTSQNPDTSNSGAQMNLAAIRGSAQFKAELKPFTISKTLGATTDYQAFYNTCNIRLKDLSSFFENFAPTKAAYCRLTINLNLGSLAPTMVAGGVSALSGSNNTFQNCCPVILTQSQTGSNFNATTTQAVVGVYIGQVGSSLGTINQSSLGIAAHPLSSCRITAPLITMSPESDRLYATNNLNKTILYEDVYSTQINNIASNSSFNYLCTNGIKGAMRLILLPMISSTINGRNTELALTTPTFSPMLSPYATEPATTSPLSITQFQVQYGGTNLLSPYLSYSYENFIQQLQGLGLNGGQSTSLCSGLINEMDWGACYRYYVCNLSRGNDEDSTLKSIVVSGFNNNLVAADYLVFVVYRKRAVINTQTGKLVSLS